jgi:release factor glutamine methyltransferase
MTYDEVVVVLRAAGCVFAEDEARLLLEAPGDLRSLLERRVAGEPLEQVLGWVDFAGVRVRLEPGVFVPRQRTAMVVDEAERLLAGVSQPRVVDLCCGSGAIGLALSARVDGIRLLASDVEAAAVRCARRNLGDVRAEVFESDLFDSLPASWRGEVQVITCNVPYVPTGAIASMPPEAREHEPRITLDGGPDGLDVLRRVAAQAALWLVPGGSLLVEVGAGQVASASEAFVRAGLTPRVVRDDEVGALVLVGTSAQSRNASTTAANRGEEQIE